jgi:hypothetical protein
MIKIINKTAQTFQLVDKKILKPHGTLVIQEINEQIKSLEKKGLIIIKVI